MSRPTKSCRLPSPGTILHKWWLGHSYYKETGTATWDQVCRTEWLSQHSSSSYFHRQVRRLSRASAPVQLSEVVAKLRNRELYFHCSGLTSFDISRYTGTWYEYSNVFEVFQIGGKCVRATYTDNGGGTVGVFNEQIKSLWVYRRTTYILRILLKNYLDPIWLLHFRTGSYGSINGTARLADPGYAEFVVNFDKVPCQYWENLETKWNQSILVTTSTPNYRVLDTDYTSFSIVYNCNTILGLFKSGKNKEIY